MTALAVVAAMVAACLGWGAVILRAAGVAAALTRRETLTWSFGLGMGALGWLGFLVAAVGRVDPVGLAAPIAAGLPGLWLLRPQKYGVSASPLGPWSRLMLGLAAMVMLGDLVEAWAPPTDADSLAYHFAIPREMLARGGLVFVSRAADGAIPLLLQTTYLIALGLGGESAMTLWCCVSGWSAAALTYALGRTVMSRDWSLAMALAVMTMPAMLYGAGTGQVEARMAVFATLAVVAALRSRRPGGTGLAVVAGLAAGFCMASKYPGLLVAFLCGVAVLTCSGGFRRAAAFSVVCLLAGGQWYVWNWINTGDPVFPLLFGAVPYHPGVAWNAAQAEAFRHWSNLVEAPLPRGWMATLTYPLLVTFAPPDVLDAGRTGLGVLPVLLLPFAVLGGWRHRHSPAARTWLGAAAVCLGFYVLWTAFGASQRVRHYLPLMPLVLVGLGGAAATLRGRQAALGTALVLLVQSGGQGIFVQPFLRHILGGESRDAGIERMVPMGFAVTWANSHLRAGDKLLMAERQWNYLLDVPSLFVTPNQQAVVEIRDNNTDPRAFWRQVRASGSSHAMLPYARAADIGAGPVGNPFFNLVGAVVEAGCGRVVEVLNGPAPAQSRTLSPVSGVSARVEVPVVVFSREPCPLDDPKFP